MAPRIGVFHPGTQHSWQTALAFQEDRRLGWYATSVFYDPARWPYRLERFVPSRFAVPLHRDLSRRYLPALAPENVRQFGLLEWAESGVRRLGGERLARWINWQGNVAFGKAVTRLIEREPVDVLWGYNTSSLEVFRWAKPRGIRCILDQTTGHCLSFGHVMQRERERHPEFFHGSTRLSAMEIERQTEELALADLVVVGSAFCAATLVDNGCAPSKIRTVPYGYDETLFPTVRPARAPLAGRPMRFLFVGAIRPGKGIAHLLKAFQNISPEVASLTLVGGLAIPASAFEPYRRRIYYHGSLPRPEVVEHFLAADCFIFPSLFEGGGIALYEAGGAGLGIIQSASCGDGVREGRNGAILAEVSPDCIRAAVLSIVENPERLRDWQQVSWEMRAERTWQRYREQVRSLVSS